MTTDYLQQARALGLERSSSWKRFCKNFESIAGLESTLSGMGMKLRKSKKTQEENAEEEKSDAKNPFLKAKGRELLPKLISENARLSARLLCAEGIVPPESEDNVSNIIAAQAGDSRRIESVSEFKALLGYLGDYEAASAVETKTAELREIFSNISRLPKITEQTEFAKDACLAAPLVLRDLAMLGGGSQGWIVASTIVAKGIMRAAGARTLDADPFEGRCAKKFAAYEMALQTAAMSEDGMRDLADQLFTAVNSGFSSACAAAQGKKTASEKPKTPSDAKLARKRQILKWIGMAAFAWTAFILLMGLLGEHGVFRTGLEEVAGDSAPAKITGVYLGIANLFFGKANAVMPILTVTLAIWAMRLPEAIRKRNVSQKHAVQETRGVTMLMTVLGLLAGFCHSATGAVAAAICFYCYANLKGYMEIGVLRDLLMRKLASREHVEYKKSELTMCIAYLSAIAVILGMRVWFAVTGIQFFKMSL